MVQKTRRKSIKSFYLASILVAGGLLCGSSNFSYAQVTATSAATVQKFDTNFNAKAQAELGAALNKAAAEGENPEADKIKPIKIENKDSAATDKKTEGDQVKKEDTLDDYVGKETTVIGGDPEKATDDFKATQQPKKPKVPKKLVVLPETDWKVRQIPRKGKNGIGYCSLNKSFKSGQTLFLSKDASMSNTIAIDFQNELMEVGRQYVVILKAGDVSKKITAIAATPKIIIMKTGASNEIFDEFVKSKKAEFRVGADILKFRFSNSIIDALNKLTDCAASVKKGTKFRGQTIEKSSVTDAMEPVTSGTYVGGRKAKKATPPKVKEMPTTVVENDKVEERISPKRNEVAEIATRLVNKKGLKGYLRQKQRATGKLSLLKSPNQVVAGPSAEELELIRQETLKEDLEQKKQINKLAETIKKLKRENQRLLADNQKIIKTLEKQKVQSASSQSIVEKTRKELLGEINELRKTQKMLAMQDVELQKSSHNVILDTQNRQMEIISEIKRLREENARLKSSATEDKTSSMKMIAKNKAEMDRLREENLQLALQQELEEEVRKKQEIKNEMEKNRIRSELVRLKSENTQLAMDLETGKSDIVWKTEQIKQQQRNIARAAQIEWENTKDFASVSYDTQQKLIEETEKLKFENERLKDLTLKEKQETRKLAQESARKQDEINEEIARIKRQNDEMMARIRSVKEQSMALQEVQEGYISPMALYDGADSYLGMPRSDGNNLKKWLYVSGAAGSSYIEVEENAGGSQKLYRWQDRGVYGLAKEVPDISSTSINKVVADYIDDLSSNCKGDFAKTSGHVKMLAPYEVLEAETACMGRKNSSAAVILFVLGRDKINIIMQETSPANINTALENRDKIIRSIK